MAFNIKSGGLIWFNQSNHYIYDGLASGHLFQFAIENCHLVI